MRFSSPIPALSRRDVLVLGSAAAAVALTAGKARAEPSDTLQIAFNVPIGTLDPGQFHTGGMEYNYACCVFNRLTKTNAQSEVLPELATHWDASPDLKTWTFYLRPGIKFHNGKSFGADDVIFSYRRLQNPSSGSIMMALLAVIEKMEAPDPLTVRFTLSHPYCDMPALVSFYELMIVTESAVAALTTHPVGTGPFKFVDYRPGDQMMLDRNPDYFEPGVPKLAHAVLRVMTEYTTSVAALESGEIDVVFDLPPEQVEHVKRAEIAHIAEVSSNFWQGYIMNCAMKPFDDPRIREAFIKIVDRPSFTDVATFGHATPTITPIPPNNPYYRKDIPLTADIPGARKLLAEAGFPAGSALEMYVPGNSPPMERLANVFRDAAKQVDVDVTLRVVPQDKFFAEDEGNVPLNVDQFLGRSTPDLSIYDMYHSSGAWNRNLWHYKNDEVDHVLDAARQTLDRAEQAKFYGRFQEIVAKDGPGAVVYVQSFACGVAKYVDGIEVLPLQLIDINRASLTA